MEIEALASNSCSTTCASNLDAQGAPPGELALSPVGLSVTTKLAPKRFVGQMMGMWFLATARGNLIAGRMAGEFDATNVQAMPGQYLQIVLVTGGVGIIMLLFTKPIKKLVSGVE